LGRLRVRRGRRKGRGRGKGEGEKVIAFETSYRVLYVANYHVKFDIYG